ncbi:hypothetical protein [Catelliglobosispora koreensis]|uniref:hypothetical protein n=1 Tax=Catelliglobosispora koreensis TaxID=129052 RepID=UPI0003763E60|nr:hypothetical protein [Catelliglobosispora koreensis]
MAIVLFIIGLLTLAGGLFVLVTKRVPRAWAAAPPWIFAGVLFSCSVAALAFAAGQQVEQFSSLEWVLFLVRMAGFGGMITFAMLGRKYQTKR